MIKKTLFIGAAVLLLGVLLTGRGMVSYVTTAASNVHHRMKSKVPIEFEIDRARGMIEDLKPEIEQNMLRIAREEVEVAKLQRNLARQEQMLAKSRGEILRLRDDVGSGGSHFVYAGRSYSVNQVKADLANRFQHFRTAEATVDKLQRIMAARENGLGAAREKLESMLASKRQLEVEVENLQARSKMIEVAQTTSEFNFDDSRLARTRELIDEIGTRLDVSEKILNQAVQLNDRIPLDVEETDDHENVVDAVTRYFEESPETDTLVKALVQ